MSLIEKAFKNTQMRQLSEKKNAVQNDSLEMKMNFTPVIYLPQDRLINKVKRTSFRALALPQVLRINCAKACFFAFYLFY